MWQRHEAALAESAGLQQLLTPATLITILMVLFLFLSGFGTNDSQFCKCWSCFPLPTCSNDRCKLPAAAPEGQIFLIFLSLGMWGKRNLLNGCGLEASNTEGLTFPVLCLLPELASCTSGETLPVCCLTRYSVVYTVDITPQLKKKKNDLVGLLFVLRNQRKNADLASLLPLRFLTGLPTEWVLPNSLCVWHTLLCKRLWSEPQGEWKSCLELAARTKLSQWRGNCLSGVLWKWE